MNPSAVSQENLASWARKMGFQLPDGSFPDPSYFASACCTSNRRKLWEAIISKVEDRRRIIKVDENHERRSDLIKKIQSSKKEADLEEEEIDRQIKKLKERAAKIARIERSIHEKNLKSLLFRRICAENTKREDGYRSLQTTIQELSDAPRDQPINVAQQWIKKTREEASTRLSDPALLDEITSNLGSDNMACASTWYNLIQRHHELQQLSSSFSTETKTSCEKMLKRSVETDDWQKHMATQFVDSTIIDSIALLMQGQQLRLSSGGQENSAMIGVKESATSIISRIIEERRGVPITTSEELKKLQIKHTNALSIYNDLQQEVNSLREQYTKWTEESVAEGARLEGLAAEVVSSTRREAPHWRQLVQKRSRLVAEHTDFLEHRPLDDIRSKPYATPLLKSLEILVPDVVLGGSGDCLKELYHLTQHVKNGDYLSEEQRKEEALISQLRSAQSHLQVLSNETGKLDRMIAICGQQPFGEMIPASETINRMTFKEWKMQIALSSLPRSTDYSVSVYAPDF